MVTTLPAGEFFGSTIFCDDIRNEVGGKISLIGVYSNVMIFQQPFPVILPKFCFAVSYAQREDAMRHEPVKIRIYLPGDEDEKPSIEGEIPYVQPPKENPINEVITKILVPGLPVYLSMHGEFSFAQVLIKQAGLIKVRAMRGDDMVRLGSLPVIHMPPRVLPADPQN